MTEAEYREFLSFLFERYVRPRLGQLRRRHRHHFEDEFAYHLDEAVRCARVFRFIESYCWGDDEVYETFRLERLDRAVRETHWSSSFSVDLAEEAGFIDAYESHRREIADGLDAVHLPDADKDILHEIGSPNPEVELRSIVYRAKRWWERSNQLRETGLHQEMKHAEERLKQEASDFRELKKAKEETPPRDVPQKRRRWFKGLGQISQGTALSIANGALAIGTLNLPVSPETQTWGAMSSVAAGIGTLLSGIGDLRNE
jgi:hypothetical protein